MYKDKVNIDWLDVVVDIWHEPAKVSKGLKIYLDEDYNFDKAQKSYRSKLIESQSKHVLKLKSVNNKLRISGNFYKWLHGQNVTGCASVIDLVLNVLKKLAEMDIFVLRDWQLGKIEKGHFRIYQIHIKQDTIFDNKQLALAYLEQLKVGGYYPYRSKSIYQNGVYFGQSSKRWVLGCYHKGKEIDQKRTKKDIVDSKLKARADVMIRTEMKIYSKQLKGWDLIFAWQWNDIGNLDKWFDKYLEKLSLPNFNYIFELLKIKNNADKKFYNCLLNGDVDIVYSRSTIHRKRLKFMQDYNINIDNINNKLKENVCKS